MMLHLQKGKSGIKRAKFEHKLPAQRPKTPAMVEKARRGENRH